MNPILKSLQKTAAVAARVALSAGIEGGRRLPGVIRGAGNLAASVIQSRRSTADHAPGPGQGTPPAPAQPPAATGNGTPPPGPYMRPPVAPAPPETPGPSVTPPAMPESDVERAERIDAGMPDPGAIPPDDVLVAQEEAAAAAEAAAIGGGAPTEGVDPAMEPVYQAGGGEQDGWEAAEADLIENATHGDGGGDPIRDAPHVEAEADRSTAVYGESDQIESTEVVEDPTVSGEDPGEGPGLPADRGSGLTGVDEHPTRLS